MPKDLHDLVVLMDHHDLVVLMDRHDLGVVLGHLLLTDLLLQEQEVLLFLEELVDHQRMQVLEPHDRGEVVDHDQEEQGDLPEIRALLEHHGQAEEVDHDQEELEDHPKILVHLEHHDQVEAEGLFQEVLEYLILMVLM